MHVHGSDWIINLLYLIYYSFAHLYVCSDSWQLPEYAVGLTEITASGAVVTWETIENLPDSIQQYYKYILQYRLEGESDWTEFKTLDHEPDGDGRQRETLTGLQHDTRYKVQVRYVRTVRGLNETTGDTEDAVLLTECTGKI